MSFEFQGGLTLKLPLKKGNCQKVEESEIESEIVTKTHSFLVDIFFAKTWGKLN